MQIVSEALRFVREAAKAVVAAVVPVVSMFITQVVADLEVAVGVAIAAGAEALAVYWTKNASEF